MKNIICAYNISEEIETNLIKLNVNPIKLRGIDKFGEVHPFYPFHPLSYHPDMFCFRLEENKWIFYDGVGADSISALEKTGVKIDFTSAPKSCEYPFDVGLNAAMFGDYLICNVKYTNEKIIEYAKQKNKQIIDVNQGYTKCSVCIVDDNSIITSDESIYKKAKQNNINVLLIDKGHINLDGYNYGFIGGCSGLINQKDKNKLAFTGDITLHPNYTDIKNFCDDRGVEIISLSTKKLYDYGSLLCI